MADISRENQFLSGEGRYGEGLSALARSLRRGFAVLLGIVVLLLLYFISWGGYFSVEPQQAVIVLRFGKPVECLTSGGHWYVPYPVHRFVRIQTSPQFLTVDLDAASQEKLSAFTPGRDRYLLTGDANVVHTSWRIAYRIADPLRYYTKLAAPAKPLDNNRPAPDPTEIDADGFAGTRGPQTLLRNLFNASLIEATAQSRVDGILSSEQTAYRDAVLLTFGRKLEAMDCGITITGLTLDRIFPPKATQDAFAEVTASGNTRDTLRNEALAYKIEVSNDTLAKKAAILADAETYRKQVVSVVRAESAYFEKISKECRRSPETVLMALYSAALNDALDELDGNKFILGSKGETRKQLRLLLNPEAKRPDPVKEEKK
ncbi:MAG: hypothetical protein MJ016_04410 [Victivallaceae bacterium]|nr:hypothetical protein [Victivallaceae bacterium]